MSIPSRIFGLGALVLTALAVPFGAACGKSTAEPTSIHASAVEEKRTEPLGADACRALHREAAQALADARAQNDGPCKSDGECVMVPTDACWSGGDCGGMPMARTGEPAVRKKATELAATTCAKWNEGQCPTVAPLPTPSCPAREPACIDGRCATRSPFRR